MCAQYVSLFPLWLLGFVLRVEGLLSPPEDKILLLDLFRYFENFIFGVFSLAGI